MYIQQKVVTKCCLSNGTAGQRWELVKDLDTN